MLSRKPRILVAEADPDQRAAFTWCLLSEGFSVEPVSNAFDAAGAFERPDLPDLVIVDMGLPGMPAWKLIECMRTSERLRHIPIIATSHAEPFAGRPPEVSFLKKPCPHTLLLQRVRAQVAAKPMSAPHATTTSSRAASSKP